MAPPEPVSHRIAPAAIGAPGAPITLLFVNEVVGAALPDLPHVQVRASVHVRRTCEEVMVDDHVVAGATLNVVPAVGPEAIADHPDIRAPEDRDALTAGISGGRPREVEVVDRVALDQDTADRSAGAVDDEAIGRVPDVVVDELEVMARRTWADHVDAGGHLQALEPQERIAAELNTVDGHARTGYGLDGDVAVVGCIGDVDCRIIACAEAEHVTVVSRHDRVRDIVGCASVVVHCCATGCGVATDCALTRWVADPCVSSNAATPASTTAAWTSSRLRMFRRLSVKSGRRAGRPASRAAGLCHGLPNQRQSDD